MRILHVNTSASGGGAARLASDLAAAQQQAEHAVTMVVGRGQNPTLRTTVVNHECYRHPWARLSSRLLGRLPAGNRLARCIGRPFSSFRVMVGHEDFDFPGSWHILDRLMEKPDVLHLHNLHGAYFDLRTLPWLSHQVPTVVTLHDAWMLSGHCSHSFECELWRTGCGQCPDLGIYPAIRRDATAYNWRRKTRIFSQSRLHVVSPSSWLMNRAKESILAPAMASSRVIPHGIDLDVFQPGDRRQARKALGLPQEANILLFAAKGIRNNIWKDYPTMRRAFEILSTRTGSRKLLFIALGEDGPREPIGSNELWFIPHLSDRSELVKHYQAADIYVHAARAEAWGLTITEAMACGLPVVASAVGGIPDQVADKQTGFLVVAGDASQMANRVERLLSDATLRENMGERATRLARSEFSVRGMADRYVGFYRSILNRQPVEIDKAMERHRR